jgi:hypothetical protein
VNPNLKLRTIFWSLTALAPICLGAQSLSLPMQPGKYEVVTSSGLRNGLASEPKKTTRCLRAEEMVNLDYIFNARVINAYKADDSCKPGALDVKDGKMRYSADCKFEKVKIDGEVTAIGYSVTRTAISKASGGVSLVSTLEGRRIADCR